MLWPVLLVVTVCLRKLWGNLCLILASTCPFAAEHLWSLLRKSLFAYTTYLVGNTYIPLCMVWASVLCVLSPVRTASLFWTKALLSVEVCCVCVCVCVYVCVCLWITLNVGLWASDTGDNHEVHVHSRTCRAKLYSEDIEHSLDENA